MHPTMTPYFQSLAALLLWLRRTLLYEMNPHDFQNLTIFYTRQHVITK